MTTPVLDLDTLVFAKGAHETRGAELCMMEAVAWVACEPHSDAPVCKAMCAVGRQEKTP